MTKDIAIQFLRKEFGAGCLRLPNVIDETVTLHSLGCDDLDVLEIIMIAEDELGIDIPDDEVELLLSGKPVRYLTLGQLLSLLQGNEKDAQ